MKIAIIGSVGIPAKYGGFETLVHHLVQNLGEEYSFTVYCSSKAYPEKPTSFGPARLKYIPLDANGIQSIPYDVISMTSAILSGHDVLLVLGVSGALFLPLIRLFTSKKIILHIDGLEWKRNKWNAIAKKFLKYSEYIGIKFSQAIIADNHYIQTYIQDTYQRDSALIEYGADHIIKAAPVSSSEDYAFSVCRIEPENNVRMMLEGFSKMPEHKLKFVGNWNKSEYGRQLFDKYAVFKNIELIHPIYDQGKLDTLRANCYIYIHGHSAGGTNPSLVEAMYLGLPVLAFNAPYNRATTEEKALYFNDVDELVTILGEIDADGHRLEIVRANMERIARQRYTWKSIAQKYKTLFTQD